MKQIMYLSEKGWKAGFYIGGVVYAAGDGSEVCNYAALKELPWLDLGDEIRGDATDEQIMELLDPDEDVVEPTFFKTPVNGGEIIASISEAPDYPGIDIEVYCGEMRYTPRVLVEFPKEEKEARVLVWNDPTCEDYTFKVNLPCIPYVKDFYEIYLNRKYPFSKYEYLVKKDMPLKAMYEKVYSGELNDMNLEDIYTKFNINHPEDYKNRSLSVGDVVVVAKDGKETAYMVDSVGFKKVEEF